MDFLQGLTAILGQSMGATPGQQRSASTQSGAAGMGGLGSLLSPEILGGLMGALFSGKQGGAGNMGASTGMGGGGGLGALGGLLGSLMGGGSAGSSGGGDLASSLGGLFGGHSAQTAQAQRPAPVQANPTAKVERLLRAIVYAAKADGHIDDREQAAINSQLQKLNLGPEGKQLVQQAMDEPLDPNKVAYGVQDQQEAMQLYVLSRLLTNADQFMEKSYLDALATALNISPDARNALEQHIAQQA
jgi:Uncharacterized protein conserved in bacteria